MENTVILNNGVQMPKIGYGVYQIPSVVTERCVTDALNVGYRSVDTAQIAYAMAKTSYSGEMVRNNKKVILTIPGVAIAGEVMGCGMSTGRDTDKIAKLGIEMQEVPNSEIKIPLHSRVAIKCSLKKFIETGGKFFIKL